MPERKVYDAFANTELGKVVRGSKVNFLFPQIRVFFLIKITNSISNIKVIFSLKFKSYLNNLSTKIFPNKTFFIKKYNF